MATINLRNPERHPDESFEAYKLRRKEHINKPLPLTFLNKFGFQQEYAQGQELSSSGPNVGSDLVDAMIRGQKIVIKPKPVSKVRQEIRKRKAKSL